ncbi:hypothetical protein BCV70DRAFT_201867 [Testicularia cyperi]|uniref:Uncharacterized protein n=1 Tax=Testicularia cyperi TaxID=1882483 RepID=A0A317XKH0_9BASI|nr:hypothetical protein BCV70DRAFT_201867 [Testicularia cyperi]
MGMSGVDTDGKPDDHQHGRGQGQGQGQGQPLEQPYQHQEPSLTVSVAQPQSSGSGSGSDVGCTAPSTRFAYAADATPAFRTQLGSLAALLTRVRADPRLLQQSWPRLRGVKTALDSGKRVGAGAGRHRGLPLSLVIPILKSEWHNDGTWPLDCSIPGHGIGIATGTGTDIGSNEQQEKQKPTSMSTPAQAHVPPQDPSPDQIATAYRSRGIAVPDAIPVLDDW